MAISRQRLVSNWPRAIKFAWLLARCRALRPGAIGTPNNKVQLQYLAWKDVELSKGAYSVSSSHQTTTSRNTTYFRIWSSTLRSPPQSTLKAMPFGPGRSQSLFGTTLSRLMKDGTKMTFAATRSSEK
ncbi:hypothetical protein C8034_v006129 [Colletotrichum sidae]|uniref:Uncharacterized protein n=1 Tax=Colletotrichum sidae TaxID=1347389 RepID=A0A4R8TT72_9PEZI|nr:hypothetical protein C8034_v006129 [Colletotrichum sidae]